jgi:hypothetical protein
MVHRLHGSHLHFAAHSRESDDQWCLQGSRLAGLDALLNLAAPPCSVEFIVIPRKLKATLRDDNPAHSAPDYFLRDDVSHPWRASHYLPYLARAVLEGWIDRGHRMAGRQLRELLATTVEERVSADDQGAGLPLPQGDEGGIEVAARIEKRPSHRTRSEVLSPLKPVFRWVR